jgi:hypothetical protein
VTKQAEPAQQVVHLTVHRDGPVGYQVRQQVLDTSGVEVQRPAADPEDVARWEEFQKGKARPARTV